MTLPRLGAGVVFRRPDDGGVISPNPNPLPLPILNLEGVGVAVRRARCIPNKDLLGVLAGVRRLLGGVEGVRLPEREGVDGVGGAKVGAMNGLMSGLISCGCLLSEPDWFDDGVWGGGMMASRTGVLG